MPASTTSSAFGVKPRPSLNLQHPNIVQGLRSGGGTYAEGQQGQPYFSLEFVDGSSLDKKVRGTPQPSMEAAKLLLTLAQAMKARGARAWNWLHRDLKPANVPDGHTGPGDWATSSWGSAAGGGCRATCSCTILGTPARAWPPNRRRARSTRSAPLPMSTASGRFSTRF